MSKDKSTPLFAIKMQNFYTVLMWRPGIFFHIKLSCSEKYWFCTSATTVYWLQSSITVFKKNWYKWYLTIFFMSKSPIHLIADNSKKSTKSSTRH